jgi:inorganic pyrophosphatase
MSSNDVSIGPDAPNVVNVQVEIPAHSAPVKYEICKKTGALRVDRFLSTAMFYPCNYGYLPQTLSSDGDPLDAIVITPIPVISGCMIKCRPIDLLKMTDEAGLDNKILLVPETNITPLYANVQTIKDLPVQTIQQIEHFFAHYKDLEPNKWTKIESWEGLEAAKIEIMDSLKRWKK